MLIMSAKDKKLEVSYIFEQNAFNTSSHFLQWGFVVGALKLQ